MLSTLLTLFLAGVLTILLPCILPLVPVVVGASVASRDKWRPLITCIGLVIGFVGSSFLLQVVLRHFSSIADLVRLGTYDVLLLFGASFLTQRRWLRWLAAVLGSAFFWKKGIDVVAVAALGGVLAIELGGRVAQWLQSTGAAVQSAAREEFGAQSRMSALIIGITLGLVWVPCAGPALGFALVLVRERPGAEAFAALLAYGLGAAVPLLLIGYGGQRAVQSTRLLSRYSERIKQGAGVVMMLSALALYAGVFIDLQTWLTEHTNVAGFADRLEKRLVGEDGVAQPPAGDKLPVLRKAPVIPASGPWHNSPPLTADDLRGKVVLVDFWTYSCINCIRTLPYIQGYWETYKDQPFVLLGVHTPEFAFEHLPENVRDAIERRGLTYPVVQDNDYKIWRAFSNRYWPAKYLIDAQGRIRYVHFGEGAYEETSLAIASLLREAGGRPAADEVQEPSGRARRTQTPETYFSSRSDSAFGNPPNGDVTEVQSYAAPERRRSDAYYLAGRWQLLDDERKVLRSSTGSIHLTFLGAESNIVLGIEPGAAPGRVDVFIDGEQTDSFTVDRHDLYPLFTGAYSSHDLRLQLTGEGIAAYAFTFGS